MSVSPDHSRRLLHTLITARLSDSAAAWLAGTRQKLGELDALRRALGQTGRACGSRPLIGAFAERDSASIETALGPMKVGTWRTDEAVHTWLAAEVADATPSPYSTLFELYDRGDTQTRAACVRALNLVASGPPEDGLKLIADAGRTYLSELMGAAWCNNPWASRHLSDHDFRKAVLKAFFCEVPVADILGLEERADAELAQSLWEYADEREAAGRAVPNLVFVVAALHPRPGLVARMIGRLEHPLPEERLAAAKALARAADSRAESFLTERLARESEVLVRTALEAALAAIECP